MWKFKSLFPLFFIIIPACAFAQENSTDSRIPVATIACSQKRFEEAAKAFRGRGLQGSPERLLKTLVRECANAFWIDQASSFLSTVQEERSDSLIKIGLYYQQKYENGESIYNSGATIRYREVMEKYPHYSRTDYVLLILGNAYLSSDQLDDAFTIYTRLINEFPTSEYVQDAYERLDVLAKRSIDPASVKVKDE